MPQIMDLFGYKIYFWANESLPLEPVHVHVSKKPNQNGSKIWLTKNGKTQICNNSERIPPKDLRKIAKVLELYYKEIFDKWERYFGQIRYIDDNTNNFNKAIEEIQQNFSHDKEM